MTIKTVADFLADDLSSPSSPRDLAEQPSRDDGSNMNANAGLGLPQTGSAARSIWATNALAAAGSLLGSTFTYSYTGGYDYGNEFAAPNTGYNLSGTLAVGYSGRFAYRNNPNETSIPRADYSGVSQFNITLGTGNDLVRTGDGNDTVSGNNGSDHLITGRGADVIDGGAGADRWEADKSDATSGLTINTLDGAAASPYSIAGVGGSVSNIEALGTDSTHRFQAGAGNDVITTNQSAYSDYISTNSGNDSVKVFAGTDEVSMGAGSDTLVVDYSANGYDKSSESTDPLYLWSGSLAMGYNGTYAYRANPAETSVPRVIFTGVEHFDVTLGSGNDLIRTGDGNDKVSGNAGNDHLITGSGVDTVDGGEGSDRWEADKSELTAGQAVIVNITATTSASHYGGAGSVTGIEMLTLKTGAGNDDITTLQAPFSDLIATNGGNDRVKVAGGPDEVSMGAGSDTLVVDYSDNGYNKSSEFADAPYAWSGSLASGYSGAYAYRANPGDTNVPRVLFSGVEHFDITLGSGHDQIRTGDGNDRVSGGAGDDHFMTGKGADTIDGGDGADRWDADKSGATAAIALNLMNPLGSSYTIDGLVGSVINIEALGSDSSSRFQSGSGNDSISTHEGFYSDYIATNAGDDSVKVFGGTDVVSMGSGNDTLIVDYSANGYDKTSESADPLYAWSGSLAAGYNGAYAYRANPAENSVPRVVFTGVENFYVTLGSGNDLIRTGDGNDKVSGNAGNDHLITGSGVDTVDGGEGSDRWEADKSDLTSTQALIVNITLPTTTSHFGGAGSVTGIEMLTLKTGAGNDDITTLQAAFSDLITTNDGNDRVKVAGGPDEVSMGAGSDTLVVDYSGNSYDKSSEFADAPYAWSGSLASGYSGAYAYRSNPAETNVPRVLFSGVEHFDVTLGGGNDQIRTGDGNDRVNSGDGGDHLMTGKGADTIDGGTGADRWDADKSAASVALNINLMNPLGSSYTIDGLTGSVINIEALGTDSSSRFQSGSGDDFISTHEGFYSDYIATNAGNDSVKVFSGTDVVDMGPGNDTLIVDYSANGYDKTSESTDPLYAWSGSLATGYNGAYAYRSNPAENSVPRVVFTGVENFYVTLGSGNDLIRTGDGNDTFFGGAGDDVLTSGGGSDVFSYASSGNGVDTLTDFAPGDVIRVATANFSSAVQTGNGSALAQYQVQVSTSGSVTTLTIGTDATPGADITIRLNGVFAPSQLYASGANIGFVSAAPQTVTGGNASDKFTSGSGNDIFDGGAGTDTVIFSGTRAAHTITKTATGWTVSSSADGTDTIKNVERLQFSDSSVALDLDAANSAGGIYRLYGATFNRTPDLGGLGYWIAQADKGKSAVDMAIDFTYSPEFQSLFATKIIDNYATGANVVNLVTGFYTNVLHRTPDAAGRDWYANEITTHSRTVGQVLAEISDSPENVAQLAGVIANGIVFTAWNG